MRSKIAEELHNEQIEDLARRTPSERIALIRKARERGLRLYMAGQRVDRDTAINSIRRERQIGRKHSRCMIESLQ